MPTPVIRARAALALRWALLCACPLMLTAAPLAEASTPAGIRVVAPDGQTLAEATQLTGPARLKTSPKADCFGPGTGGSGDRVTVPGSTALGQLANAGEWHGRISPLGVTDAFDFGLGICRIGRAVAPATGYWYLKVDHAASFSGADQTKVRRGDEILWYLITDFNDQVPDELELDVPARIEAGVPFEAKVTAYADDGDASPAAGATVIGADAPTDAQGRTMVTVDGTTATLRATRPGAIASNSVAVCTTRAADCPPGYAEFVGGTAGRDRITGSKDAETIVAGGGRDRIEAVRGRARDRINCGGGKDRLVIRKGSGAEYRGCERVKRRR